MTSTTDPIASLGADVFLEVIEHLSPGDIIPLDGVSRSWRDFVHEHEIWRRVCRRHGIDVREHRHAQGERAAIERVEPYSGELVGQTTPGECRRAYLDDLRLSEAWTKRFGYENLVKAPAFKLRSVYMDNDEDFLYALTESGAMSREECLLVLNKYTGQLLQRIPGIKPHANVAVGAGYVAVSQYQRDCPRDRRREYSILGNVTVFRTKQAAERANSPWRDRGPVEFACALTDEDVTTSDVMTVNLVQGHGVLVAADRYNARFIDLDQGRRKSIQLARVDTVDSQLLRERSMRDKDPKVWSVSVTNDHLFVVTQYQVHMFSHTGDKIAAYPDPCADYLTHVALGYGVDARYPYGNEYERAPKTPENAPPGLGVAETLKWEIPGYHPNTHEFSEAVEEAMGYPSELSDDEYDSDDSGGNWRRAERFRFDGLNATLQEVVFTTNDMVIRAREGAIFIIRDYRKVLQGVLELDMRERAAFIGRNAIMIAFCENNDVVAAHRDRIVVHAADSIVFVLDTSQLPSLPWLGDEQTPIPPATAHSFEVSSLEGMQDESSVVIDARAVYMADWDKGAHDPSISYEDMNDAQRDEDEWPFPIRPCWGCIKVWTFRPSAALLRRPGVKEWAAEQHRVTDLWHQPQMWHVPTPPLDWQESLGGLAEMLDEDVSWREDDDLVNGDDEEVEEVEDEEVDGSDEGEESGIESEEGGDEGEGWVTEGEERGEEQLVASTATEATQMEAEGGQEVLVHPLLGGVLRETRLAPVE